MKGGQSPSLELVSRSSESNVWNHGLPAAGPIRPSLPWCFGAATGSAKRRQASWQVADEGRAKSKFGASF